MKDEYICFTYMTMPMLLPYINFPLFKKNNAFIISDLSSNHVYEDLSMSLRF